MVLTIASGNAWGDSSVQSRSATASALHRGAADFCQCNSPAGTVNPPAIEDGRGAAATVLQCLLHLSNHGSFRTLFATGNGVEQNVCNHAGSFGLISIGNPRGREKNGLKRCWSAVGFLRQPCGCCVFGRRPAVTVVWRQRPRSEGGRAVEDRQGPTGRHPLCCVSATIRRISRSRRRRNRAIPPRFHRFVIFLPARCGTR